MSSMSFAGSSPLAQRAWLSALPRINCDWSTSADAHRLRSDEVRPRCAVAELDIGRENLQGSGITLIARRRTG
jgi:hypothetical protein